MSIESKLQSLLTASNNTTGESDTTLTDAVQSLIDGYGGGGGLPEWIEEMDVVEYIPTADTNEEKSFAINMTAAPDLVIVASNITAKTANKQFVGLVEFSNVFGIGVEPTDIFRGTVLYTMFANYITAGSVTMGSSNDSGILRVSNNSISMNTYYYSGAMVSWTAGKVYKIIAIKTKAVDEW